VCKATYQPVTKSNPNANPTTKQHTIVNDNSAVKLRHPRSDAYSAEQVILNK